MGQTVVAVEVPVGPSEISRIAAEFPTLTINEIAPRLVLVGEFELADKGVVFDSYTVRIEVGSFPETEPKVFELLGRVKKGQHRNPDGTCCTGVFEVWRVQHPKATLLDFLNGPVRNYFLGHRTFEKSGEWPFGELTHGVKGLIEAAAALLDISPREAGVIGFLQFLSRNKYQRFRRCPCGNGKLTALCHGAKLRQLRRQIAPGEAQAILGRILYYRGIAKRGVVVERLQARLRALSQAAARQTRTN